MVTAAGALGSARASANQFLLELVSPPLRSGSLITVTFAEAPASKPVAPGLTPVLQLSANTTLYRVESSAGATPNLTTLLQQATGLDPRWAQARVAAPASNAAPRLDAIAWVGGDRTLAAGDWLQLDLRFSDAVRLRPGQTLRVDLGGGQLRELQLLGGSGSRSLRFGYRVAAGDQASAVRLDPSSFADRLQPYLAPGASLTALMASAQAATAPVQVIAAAASDPLAQAQARATFWQKLLLQGFAQEAFNPLLASRGLALLNGALFDAVNASTGSPYLGQLIRQPLAGVSAADLPRLIDGVGAGILSQLFAGKGFDGRVQAASEQAFRGLTPLQSASQARQLGQDVASVFLQARAGDLAAASAAAVPYLETYQQQNDPGDWKPTPPANAAPLQPGWGALQTWLLPSLNQALPGGVTPLTNTAIPTAPALDSAAYAAALLEVQQLGSSTSTLRTADQTQIANFWANGAGTYTPPGHWQAIQIGLAQQQSLDLLAGLRLHALSAYALADAAIACWAEKYAANLWRPVTAIRSADLDGNPLTTADPTWTPLIATPPFPTLPSGHSTFSGAAATVLAGLIGDQQSFTSTLPTDPSIQRSFESLWQAAVESGRSRIYGGIHFEFDNTSGLGMGQAVGEWVLALGAMPQTTLSSANDTYTSGGANTARAVHGGDGNDRIVAGLASLGHQFWGDAGNDELIGGGLADGLWGGSGSDRLQAGASGSLLSGSDGAEAGEVDELIGAGGIDTFALAGSNALGVAYSTASSHAVIRGYELNRDRLQLSSALSDYRLTAGSLDWNGASLSGAWLSAGPSQDRLAFLEASTSQPITAAGLVVSWSGGAQAIV